jgi:hypothetical protein
MLGAVRICGTGPAGGGAGPCVPSTVVGGFSGGAEGIGRMSKGSSAAPWPEP